jgi:hypothetical protein
VSDLVSGLSTGVLLVCNQGKNHSLGPQAPPCAWLSTAVHRLSTGYPRGFSPGLGITPGRYRLVVPRTFNRMSTVLHRPWTAMSPNVSVHSGFPRGCPHLWGTASEVIHRWGQTPVGNRWITLARNRPVAFPWTDCRVRIPTERQHGHLRATPGGQAAAAGDGVFASTAVRRTRWWWNGEAAAPRASGALLDPVRQLGDLVVERAALGHVLADLAVGVHDGRVVTSAERLPDARQG